MFGGRENILLCSHNIRPNLDRGRLWAVRGSRSRGKKRLFFLNVFCVYISVCACMLCVHAEPEVDVGYLP